jgi:acetylornithine deacetylase/succinyl-diaminopimelate desuccinylase-like protein
MSDIDTILARIDAELPQSLERLFEFIRIPSISTDAASAADVRTAAEWARAQLSELGFDASVRETDGLPMVVGHNKDADNTHHVLFYGHYDVQPVDPVSLWDTEPFNPVIVTRDDGTKQIVGRGSSDDKGQLMTFIEACRATRDVMGGLPLKVTILLEGEEETGSPSMNPFLAANKEELKADIGLVCDTSMWDASTPALTVMLRGMSAVEVTLTAASRDLHSGGYGSAACNPLHVLARIVSDLHDDNGGVTIKDFYDGVHEMPADVRTQWDSLPFDPSAFLGEVGLSEPAGEKDRSVLEQIWSRPTCEINGMHGGYIGAGTKTVIPAQANVKISFRLVGTQDPQAIIANLKAFVLARLPSDCTADFIIHGASPAITLPLDSPEFAAAQAALADEWGKPAVTMGCGGSIPIVGAFQDILGMDSIMPGFSLDDDRIHSPNEKYDLKSFHGGIRSWARIIHNISKS